MNRSSVLSALALPRSSAGRLCAIGIAVVLGIGACRDLTAPSPTLRTRDLIPGPVVVYPGDMHGWQFYDDQHDTTCVDASRCSMVAGPAVPPLGGGSAELAAQSSADGFALVNAGYRGTRFDSITTLTYATYRQSADLGNNLAIALQFNVDYDLDDAAEGYQGRLVYEPYQANPGAVTQGAWQSWDTKAGKWWGSKTSVPTGGVTHANPCVQSTPCTWSQLLAAFPNLGIHRTYGAVILKAGSGWPSFRGNVDGLTIGVGGSSTTFDFDLTAGASLSVQPPDTTPMALFDSLGTVATTDPGVDPGPYRRDIVVMDFRPNTPLAARQAALDSIGGRVVGGKHNFFDDDGTYYVRVSGGTFDALVHAVAVLHRQPQVSYASWWSLFEPDVQSHWRPNDGDGWKKADWRIDPITPDPSRQNWALEYVRAPMAWGCDTGTAATAVAVIDYGFQVPTSIKANVDRQASTYNDDYEASDSALMKAGHSRYDHGTRIASIIGAVGNDDHGMTGLAWHPRLILRDTRAEIGAPGAPVVRSGGGSEEWRELEKRHIIAAGLNGASVISISLNESWARKTYDPSDTNTTQLLTSERQVVSSAIEVLASHSQYPLVVISAGNDKKPYEVGGYSAAKHDYPNQVMIVGGLDGTGSVWPQSNTGADVYAPAVNVAQTTGTDDIRTVDLGTSFATPLVAGAAVLLKDFDPSLSPADLIRLIEEGARSEGGVKKLDAYESLRRAARRPGAPLCGNRVYASHGALVAERGATTEKLGDIGAFAPGFGNASINVRHGGRHVEVYAYPNKYAYDYTPTGWTRTSVAFQSAPLSGDGGSYNGTFSMTHDGDSTIYLRQDSTSLRVLVSDTISWDEHQVGTPYLLPSLPTWSAFDCDILRNKGEGYFCGSFDYQRGSAQKWSPVQSTVDPRDGSLYASIGFQTDSETGPPATMYNCSPEFLQTYDQCMGTRYYRETNDSLVIYRVDKVTGAFTRLGSITGARPLIVTASEDGRELLLNYQAVENGSYGWTTIGYNDARVESQLTTYAYVATCVTVAIPLTRSEQGLTMGTPTELAREQGASCPVANSVLAIPTYAPNRSPFSSSKVRP